MCSAESIASAARDVDHTANSTPSESRSMRPFSSSVSMVGTTICCTAPSVRNPSALAMISDRTRAMTWGPSARAT
jgi:hypothetical protein